MLNRTDPCCGRSTGLPGSAATSDHVRRGLGFMNRLSEGHPDPRTGAPIRQVDRPLAGPKAT
jgi:hypothetical protein